MTGQTRVGEGLCRLEDWGCWTHMRRRRRAFLLPLVSQMNNTGPPALVAVALTIPVSANAHGSDPFVFVPIFPSCITGWFWLPTEMSSTTGRRKLRIFGQTTAMF